MKKTYFGFLILIAAMLLSCSAGMELENLKFSKSKKYAIIPFDCEDKDYTAELTESVKDWLNAYGYDVIDEEHLRKENPEFGISNEEINKNYSLLIGKIKNVDAVIIGNIKLDKSTTVKEASSSSSGRHVNFIDRCNVFVIDINNGEILDKTAYTANLNAVFSSQMLIDDIAKKIALQLSPH